MENSAIKVPERGDLVAPFFYYFVIETVTETGVLCLICIIHNLTLLTETPSGRSVSRVEMCLRCLTTQVHDPDSQPANKNTRAYARVFFVTRYNYSIGQVLLPMAA